MSRRQLLRFDSIVSDCVSCRRILSRGIDISHSLSSGQLLRCAVIGSVAVRGRHVLCVKQLVATDVSIGQLLSRQLVVTDCMQCGQLLSCIIFCTICMCCRHLLR